ncbi:hypothetical protein [Flavobacterium wongokense]|uniref:hypothetical protein n=1 Tax=Flavobacterium wongokense TaxID=2910674 RepID=UPI001F19D4C7|nr:hypothetical protein [Flavobacterium sp. WG47]MCF6133399.1 hypothetical protein [Flavobacterium sp. WG47]
MNKIRLFSAVIFVSLLFTGCDPSENSTNLPNDDTFSENFGNEVSKDFIGQIVDTENHPLQNVSVKIGTSTAQTDANGIFIINGATVHERFAFVTAAKAGYIDGSRTMVPTSGKNNLKIMLIPNTPLQTVQSGLASEVSLPSGTKVSFDGAFQDEDGNPYSGVVTVAMFHLLPGNENLDKLMPGMLYAQTKTNQEASLATFGMLNVELRGNTGQKLNIKEGHTAEITMKIDDNQTTSAPNSIPLWHFDEAKGYWKEDGIATKVGNKYIGEVSHFSWWNCDMPNSSILLTFNFVDPNGNPLPNLPINIVNPNGSHASGETDTNGQLSGILPANQTLTVTVFSPVFNCGVNGIVFSTMVGPFTTDTVVPNIVVTTPDVSSSNVTGMLLTCDNTNVTNGYVLLHQNGASLYSPVTNGEFSFNALYCQSDTNFTLTGVDYDAYQASTPMSYNFVSPSLNVQGIQTCNAINQYWTYQIDGGPTLNVTGILGFLDFGFERQVRAYPGNGTNVASTSNFNFYSISQPGTFTNLLCSLEIEGVFYQLPTKTLTITNMGGGGQYFEAVLDGTYNEFQTSHTIHVEFKIYRP